MKQSTDGEPVLPGYPTFWQTADTVVFVTYGLLRAGSGLFGSVTKMFETIALWVVLVLFAFGAWLTVGAVWGMATDSSIGRGGIGRFPQRKPPAGP